MKHFLSITIPLFIFSFEIFAMRRQAFQRIVWPGARLLGRTARRKRPINFKSKKLYSTPTGTRKPTTIRNTNVLKTRKRYYSKTFKPNQFNLNTLHPDPMKHPWLDSGTLGRSFQTSWRNVKSGISKRLVPLKQAGKALHSEFKRMPGYRTIKKGYRIWEHASFWILRRIPGFKYLESKLGAWGAYAIFGTLKKAALLAVGPTVGAYLKNQHEKEFFDLFKTITSWSQKQLDENKKTLLNLVNTGKWLDITKKTKHLLTTENGINLLVTVADKYGDTEINWDSIVSKVEKYFKGFSKISINDILANHIYTKTDNAIKDKFTNLFLTKLEENPTQIPPKLLNTLLTHKAQEILTSRQDKNNYYIIQHLKPHQKEHPEINSFVTKLEKLPKKTRIEPWPPKNILYIPS